MSSFQGASPSLTADDLLLMEYLIKLDERRYSRKLLHLSLANLKPTMRREKYSMLASQNLCEMVEVGKGELFRLANFDLLFFFPDSYEFEVRQEAEKAVEALRKDRFCAAENVFNNLIQFFDVGKQFDELVKRFWPGDGPPRLQSPEVLSPLRSKRQQPKKADIVSVLTPELLAKIEKALTQADVSNLVRRLHVCQFQGTSIPVVRFAEASVSFLELFETVMPGFDLRANWWLYQHLIEILDCRMLAWLSRVNASPHDLAIKVCMARLLTDDFLSFDEKLIASRRGTIIVGLRTGDLFEDLESFLFTSTFIRKRGYRVLLDSVSIHVADSIGFDKLGFDYVKIACESAMHDGGEAMQERLSGIKQRAGSAQIILSQVDSREDLALGRAAGIDLFQGRYVEQMLADDRRRRQLVQLKNRPHIDT